MKAHASELGQKVLAAEDSRARLRSVWVSFAVNDEGLQYNDVPEPLRAAARAFLDRPSEVTAAGFFRSVGEVLEGSTTTAVAVRAQPQATLGPRTAALTNGLEPDHEFVRFVRDNSRFYSAEHSTGRASTGLDADDEFAPHFDGKKVQPAPDTVKHLALRGAKGQAYPQAPVEKARGNFVVALDGLDTATHGPLAALFDELVAGTIAAPRQIVEDTLTTMGAGPKNAASVIRNIVRANMAAGIPLTAESVVIPPPPKPMRLLDASDVTRTREFGIRMADSSEYTWDKCVEMAGSAMSRLDVLLAPQVEKNPYAGIVAQLREVNPELFGAAALRKLSTLWSWVYSITGDANNQVRLVTHLRHGMEEGIFERIEERVNKSDVRAIRARIVDMGVQAQDATMNADEVSDERIEKARTWITGKIAQFKAQKMPEAADALQEVYDEIGSQPLTVIAFVETNREAIAELGGNTRGPQSLDALQQRLGFYAAQVYSRALVLTNAIRRAGNYLDECQRLTAEGRAIVAAAGSYADIEAAFSHGAKPTGDNDGVYGYLDKRKLLEGPKSLRLLGTTGQVAQRAQLQAAGARRALGDGRSS